MLSTFIIPDLATVPDDYDLPTELTVRGLPTRWTGEFCEHTGNDVRIAFYDQAYGYDTEEDGGDALVWNPNTHEVWYLSRGDVEAIQRTTPGTPFAHLGYSYYVLTEDMNHDFDAKDSPARSVPATSTEPTWNQPSTSWTFTATSAISPTPAT